MTGRKTTRRTTVVLVGILAGALFGWPAPAGADGIQIDSATVGGLRARAIGPALMSGRVAALAVAPGDPLVIYVGAASGGVWRSKDGGVSFDPVFDDHIQSIGAVAIDPQEPQTVWVGTGESWVRNSVSIGDGVYKSIDGGDTWTKVGLADSERVARIVVDPTDSNRVFVCATGHLWNANGERGVYATKDGGESWERVLFVDEDTGCSDLAIDPEDPSVLYAGMWDFRRRAWDFRSGGPGSGLYKSSDGGRTWRELTDGLPAGEKGRVAVAVAPSRPRTVYALIESENTALYRSDDLGEHWVETSDTAIALKLRPFYFAYLVVDPSNHERVYKPGLFLSVSDDGGKTFQGLPGSSHGDHHALWVNPTNPHELVLGTDGGVYISNDRGNHFRHVKALPLSQFYEVGVDMREPYNVYGGLQDNGTWRGPSRSVGGIANSDWENIGFGDGFHAYVDHSDERFVYVEYQGGNVSRRNLETGETQEIKPLPQAGDPEYRFNWNTPIHVSATQPGRVYVGAQFLFRSENRGDSWQKISPDLTTNDAAKQQQQDSGGLTVDNSTAENHTTIYTIAESPIDSQTVWVGTDDGFVQLTRDGGETWTNVTAAIPDLPTGTWVSHVEAGRFEAATALATFDGHRSGDMATHVYRTDDFGASWTRLTGEVLEGFAHVVVQDPVAADVLYLGTELGLFVSVDGGLNWARLGDELPKAPVHALAVHPRDHDLVVATHGRGIFIIDDLTPLRHLTAETLDAGVAMLPSRPSQMRLPTFSQNFPGDEEFFGENPREAATIVYFQKKRHLFGDLKLEIYDADGKLISTIPGGKRKGMNRVNWPMRLKPPTMPPSMQLVRQPFALLGPRVAAGTYTAKLVKGKSTYEAEVRLVPDPRSTHGDEDRALQQRTAMRIYTALGDLTYQVDAMTDLVKQAEERLTELGDAGRATRRIRDLVSAVESERSELVATRDVGWLSGEEKLRERLGYLYGGVNGYEGRPSDSQLSNLEVLLKQLSAAGSSFEALAGDPLARVNADLERRSIETLSVMDREAWEEKRAGGGGSAAGVAFAGLHGKLGRWYEERVSGLIWTVR